MKKLILLIVTLISSFSFSQTKDDLIGTTWIIVNIEFLDYSDEQAISDPPCLESARLSFKEDYILSESYNGEQCDQKEESLQIEYKISDKTLFVRDRPTAEWDTIKITEFSAEKMKIHQNTDEVNVLATLEKVSS